MPLLIIFQLYRVASHKLDHIMLYTSPWSKFELTISVAIGTDCIGSCKSNYITITATTLPTVSATHRISVGDYKPVTNVLSHFVLVKMCCFLFNFWHNQRLERNICNFCIISYVAIRFFVINPIPTVFPFGRNTSEWLLFNANSTMSDCSLMPTQQFFSYMMAKTS